MVLLPSVFYVVIWNHPIETTKLKKLVNFPQFFIFSKSFFILRARSLKAAQGKISARWVSLLVPGLPQKTSPAKTERKTFQFKSFTDPNLPAMPKKKPAEKIAIPTPSPPLGLRFYNTWTGYLFGRVLMPK